MRYSGHKRGRNIGKVKMIHKKPPSKRYEELEEYKEPPKEEPIKNYKVHFEWGFSIDAIVIAIFVGLFLLTFASLGDLGIFFRF